MVYFDHEMEMEIQKETDRRLAPLRAQDEQHLAHPEKRQTSTYAAGDVTQIDSTLYNVITVARSFSSFIWFLIDNILHCIKTCQHILMYIEYIEKYHI